jgi:glycosyltransferase involved in cell wall biosynthesis
VRIVHVVDYFHTDVGYQEYYLALAHARSGHAVRVVTSPFRHHSVGTPGPDEQLGQSTLDDAGVEVVRLAGRQLGHDRVWLRGLTGAIASHAPDAVHCHQAFTPTAVRTARVCRAREIPLLVDSHMQANIAPGSQGLVARAVYDTYRAAFGPYLRRAVGEWVTDTPEKKDFLVDRLGLSDEDVAIVPLGFDPQVFSFDEQKRTVARRARGWEGDLVVAVTGKLHRGKKVEWAATACERIWPDRQVRLVLAGDIAPDYLRTVEAAAPRLVPAGRLHHVPMLGRHDLAELYLAADIVMFPRLPSISIFEAVGTGAPTVMLADKHGLFFSGLFRGFRAGEPSTFHELLVAAPDRRSLAVNAAEAFSWPVIADEFVRRYEALR